MTDSDLADNSDVGPYSHVRGGTRIGSHVHIGSFAEIKNSTFETDISMGHFSYVGDAEIGARTNIGAGVVTCNFDGSQKHRSLVGADVFLGSDTMLIAPVQIGDGAVTGAGAVVTRDVAPGDRVAGVPAKSLAPHRGRQGKE
jgi:bifunctional UDP-N-acetylglucosamine pyrophosphorylase/glucosamine-1-phosphate N-acetyltransferase